MIGLCFGALVPALRAQTWLSSSDGSWGATGNWSGGAVPAGTAPVAFTNSHGGTVTVTLDGDRSQTGGMLFGGGDWSLQPGTPGTSALTLGGTITNLDGVTTLGVAGFTEGFPSPDYHLLSLRAAGPTWAAAFASERVGGGCGHRSGGQRLGEVLVYNGVSLTETQNKENDAYLSWKWFARLLPTYRMKDTDLVVLAGSGTFSGSMVMARELAPAASGLAVDGDLYLDFYSNAAATGAVIRLDELPDEGTAAVHVSGDASLASVGTVILGEARAGVFAVLQADGTLNGADNIANWALDVSALTSVGSYTSALYAQDDAVMLKISAKGTIILLR